MDYATMIAEVRAVTHVLATEATAAEMLSLVQYTLRQLRSRGGTLVDSADTTITLLADTYEYNVPADLAYIHHLEFEDAEASGDFGEWVPHFHWDLRDNAGTPQFRFIKGLFELRPGIQLLITAQQKPPVPGAAADTVPPLLEGVVQETLRTVVLGRVSMGRSELSTDRSFQRREAAVIADILASYAGGRVLPSSRRVPNR